MVKTQVQLPNRLYDEAKRVARERELSLAEVVRRGVEYITRVYPPLPGAAGERWELPEAVRGGLRPGVTLASLRDLARQDEERAVGAPRRAARHVTGG